MSARKLVAVAAGVDDNDQEGVAESVLVREARCVEVGVAPKTAVCVRVAVELREPDLVRLNEDVREVVLDREGDWEVLRVTEGATNEEPAVRREK